jgi:hypothetical protein
MSQPAKCFSGENNHDEFSKAQLRDCQHGKAGTDIQLERFRPHANKPAKLSTMKAGVRLRGKSAFRLILSRARL